MVIKMKKSKAAASRKKSPRGLQSMTQVVFAVYVEGIALNPQRIAKEAFDMIEKHYPRKIARELTVEITDDTGAFQTFEL